MFALTTWGGEGREGRRTECKSFMLQWAKTLLAQRISLGRSTASSKKLEMGNGTMSAVIPGKSAVSNNCIVQLLGLMCQNRPENGGHLFGQMYSQLHGQILRYVVKGKK